MVLPSFRVAASAEPSGDSPAPLPRPRGPISDQILWAFGSRPQELTRRLDLSSPDDQDLQLALYCCYELHYGGFVGVDAEWEWEPSLLWIRRELEHRFEFDLKIEVGEAKVSVVDVIPQLRRLAEQEGPSLSGWLETNGTLSQLREYAKHRSAYQLKEADPHTWGIPRLAGAAKAAMVAIQYDEYGSGQSESMHATLFASTLHALGLRSEPGAYLDELPAETLATTNLISLLGLHRRFRGALVGHLALFEMTSVGPMSRYSSTLRRLGLPSEACKFYDAHVVADQRHERLAIDGMVRSLLEQSPDLAADVIFGAASLVHVESRFASRLLERWQQGSSSLYQAPAA